MVKQPSGRHEREWTYLIVADEVTAHGKSHRISPNESERKAIAKRLDLVSLDSLDAELKVRRQSRGHVVEVSGTFHARVTQRCVVSLDPLQVDITDSFEAWYADHDQALSFKRAQHEAMSKREMMDLPMLEEQEDPEPIENGRIDLAELVVQYLSLAIEPYPHKEGSDYENKEPERAAPRESLRPNPFAALKNWRPKD